MISALIPLPVANPWIIMIDILFGSAEKPLKDYNSMDQIQSDLLQTVISCRSQGIINNN